MPLSLQEWLESLGNKTPAPGGGAVAGINAALAAASLKMVCEYSTGPKYAAIEGQIKQHIDKLAKLTKAGQQQAENDEKAYSKLREAYALPKESAETEIAIQAALKTAVEPAVAIVDIVKQILEIAEEILDTSNQNLISDIAVSAANAKSALESSIVNIEINRKYIKDSELADRLNQKVSSAESLIKTANGIIQAVRAKINGASN